MITVEFAPYDGLLVNLDEDGHPVTFNSDISLFKRNEVLNMLPKSVDSLFDNNSNNNPYSDMSDDDIIENTKSRRIQSPSELKEWSDSIERVANYKKAMSKKAQSSKPKNVMNSEPLPKNDKNPVPGSEPCSQP